MFKYILEQAGNINWMALFALITFFTVFLISAILIFRRNPAFINHMSNLPLDDSNPITSENKE
ncbi:MAG: CcoQ/FixQ family Cbb3-type cytochrome c oxidase assembly chaperone [Bacteroidota bacterium]